KSLEATNRELDQKLRTIANESLADAYRVCYVVRNGPRCCTATVNSTLERDGEPDSKVKLIQFAGDTTADGERCTEIRGRDYSPGRWVLSGEVSFGGGCVCDRDHNTVDVVVRLDKRTADTWNSVTDLVQYRGIVDFVYIGHQDQGKFKR